MPHRRPAPRGLPPVRPTQLSAVVRERYPDYVAPPHGPRGFINPWSHPPMGTLADALRWKLGKNSARPPGYRARPIDQLAAPLEAWEALSGAATRLCWIGHATFLLELDGVRVLIDPIFGRAGGLVPRVTPPALSAEACAALGLDAVLITHGHHDHLDPQSLTALVRGAAMLGHPPPLFITPRGLGKELPRRCREGGLIELLWWEHVLLPSPRGDRAVEFHLVPAQHWHRRGLWDTNRSLWGGYVARGTHRVYHSGDTGYFGGFAAIGEVFGGVDAACLPLGAYAPEWFMGPQHMSPAGSVQAYRALHATHFVGMHWGAFNLSDETLTAGPEWLLESDALPVEHRHVLQVGGCLGLDGSQGATRAREHGAWPGPRAASLSRPRLSSAAP